MEILVLVGTSKHEGNEIDHQTCSFAAGGSQPSVVPAHSPLPSPDLDFLSYELIWLNPRSSTRI